MKGSSFPNLSFYIKKKVVDDVKYIIVMNLALFSVLVFPQAVNAAETEKIIVEFHNEEQKSFATNSERNIETIEVPEGEAEERLAELEMDENVRYAEKEVFYELSQTPNDPNYEEQRGYFENINFSADWEQYGMESKPTVAVLDSGIEQGHEDLSSAVTSPYNAVTGSDDVSDEVGHGTHVAGIAGALTNNGIGVASVGKSVNIMPVKVGGSQNISSIDIAKGIDYASENGADVINLSLSGSEPSQAVEEAVNGAEAGGAVVVSAAGNNSSATAEYPAAHENVMSVGSVQNSTSELSGFSNFGSSVDVTAPGEEILSTCTPGNQLPFYNCDIEDPYITSEGTSMAAPVVSSYAALLKAANPSLENGQIRYLIENYSDQDAASSESVKYGLLDTEAVIQSYEEEARLAGETSINTSIEISREGWDSVPETEIDAPGGDQIAGRTAVVASNHSFADGLSANTVAGEAEAPILITKSKSLSSDTVEELNRLGVDNVILAGGTAAIDESVNDSLEANGFDTYRFSGETRYETASALNESNAEAGGEVIIASGENFPDALSASPIAYAENIPIIFVKENEIPEATQKFLDKYNFSKKYIIGGPAVISESVSAELSGAERIYGETRYETTLKVNEYFDRDDSSYLLATGQNYSDALAGGPLAGRTSSSMLMTKKDILPSAVEEFAVNKNSESSGLDFLTLGGGEAVSNEVAWSLDALMYEEYYQERISEGSLKKR